jgi:hypothetical protein
MPDASNPYIGSDVLSSTVDWPRRVFTLFVDLVVMGIFTFIATTVGFGAYILLTGNDFDGPAELDLVGDWFVFSLACFFALLYSLGEVVFFTSVGRWCLDLGIRSRDGQWLPQRRALARWAIKWSPLLFLFVFSVACYQWLYHGASWGDPRFHEISETLDRIGLSISVVLLLVQFGWFALKGGRILHDDVARTTVADRQPVRRPDRRRPRRHGFDVIVRA